MIASVGLGKLLGAKRRFVERGGDLVLAALSADVKAKCTLLGVNRVFKIFNDVTAAIRSFEWGGLAGPERFRISFPPSLGIVPVVRQLVGRLMEHNGYNGRDSFRIETIVDEICNNAVEYGSSESRDNITLSLKIDFEKVEVDAENISDPAKREQLTLYMNSVRGNKQYAGREDRGRGLSLVKLLASEFSADITKSGTIVHVTKIKED